MSNGDDVLDNWEEIDEAGLTNKLHKIHAERKSLDEQQQPQLLKISSASSSTTTSFSPSPTTSTATSLQQSSFNPMKLLQRTQSQDAAITNSPTTNSLSSSSSSALKSPLDDMSASFQPVMMVLHQPVDEYQSANYTAPITSQTVKILRRPTQSSEPRNNGMRPRQPIKTLQQREQEYAEARLRILGSAKNPEDDLSSSSATTNNETTSTTTTAAAAVNATKVNGSPKTFNPQQTVYNNYQQQQMQQQQQQQQPPQPLLQQPQPSPSNIYNNSNTMITYKNQRATISVNQSQQTWSPIVGGSVSTTITTSAAAAAAASLRQQQQESLLRLPRGPDGSTGFQMRR